ncbi:MAG: hypothetical protein ACI82S_001989 [Patiriisocius sp.]|jgi:hypothetical protein
MLNLRTACILFTCIILSTACENKKTEHEVLLMPAIDKNSISISFQEAGELLSIALESNDPEKVLNVLEKMMLLSEPNSIWQSEYLVAYVETTAPYSKEYIASQFDPQEGFNILLVNQLKRTMSHPESFQHEKTQFRTENRHVVVRMAYSEKNESGAYIQKYANAGITDNGYIVLSDKNLLDR